MAHVAPSPRPTPRDLSAGTTTSTATAASAATGRVSGSGSGSGGSSAGGGGSARGAAAPCALTPPIRTFCELAISRAAKWPPPPDGGGNGGAVGAGRSSGGSGVGAGGGGDAKGGGDRERVRRSTELRSLRRLPSDVHGLCYARELLSDHLEAAGMLAVDARGMAALVRYVASLRYVSPEEAEEEEEAAEGGHGPAADGSSGGADGAPPPHTPPRRRRAVHKELAYNNQAVVLLASEVLSTLAVIIRGVVTLNTRIAARFGVALSHAYSGALDTAGAEPTPARQYLRKVGGSPLDAAYTSSAAAAGLTVELVRALVASGAVRTAAVQAKLLLLLGDAVTDTHGLLHGLRCSASSRELLLAVWGMYERPAEVAPAAAPVVSACAARVLSELLSTAPLPTRLLFAGDVRAESRSDGCGCRSAAAVLVGAFRDAVAAGDGDSFRTHLVLLVELMPDARTWREAALYDLAGAVDAAAARLDVLGVADLPEAARVLRGLRETLAEDASRRVCDVCGGGGGRLQACGRCRAVRFCSRACQERAWRAGHRAECVETATGCGCRGGVGWAARPGRRWWDSGVFGLPFGGK